MTTQTVKLGDVCEIKGGKRLPKGKNLTTTPNSHPYIRVRDLGITKVLEQTPEYEYVDDETQKTISRYIVNTDDVIISIVGTVGLVGKIGKSLNNANLTENCAKLVNIKGFDKDFLYYWLISNDGQNAIKAGTVGAVQPKLPLYNIQNISIPQIPLAEQRRVAGILGSLDEKIENNRRLIRTAEALARTLFKKHIVSNEESEGWENTTLGEICDIKIGRTPPRKETQWFSKESGKMWVSIKDMGLAGQYISDSSEYLANGSESKFNIPLIKTGTLILSFKLTVGKLRFVTKDCYSNEAIAQLPIKDTRKMSKEFLYSYLSGFDFDSLGNTSSIGTAVNSTTIKNLEIKLPPAAVLQTFSAAVEPLFAEIGFLTRENQTLAAVRDKLLRKLIK